MRTVIPAGCRTRGSLANAISTSCAWLFSPNSYKGEAALSPSVMSARRAISSCRCDNTNEWNRTSQKDRAREWGGRKWRHTAEEKRTCSMSVSSLALPSGAMATWEMNVDADQRKNWQPRKWRSLDERLEEGGWGWEHWTYGTGQG